MREPRFARPRVARDEPIERALHRRLAALAPDVGDHLPVRDIVETLAIKAAQQIALIRIAKNSLSARHRFHRRDGSLRAPARSEEHTSDFQSLMCSSYAVYCLK